MKKKPKTIAILLMGVAAMIVGILLVEIGCFLPWPFYVLGELLPVLLYFGGGLTVLISLLAFAKKFVCKILGRSGRAYYPSFWFITIIGYLLFVASAIVFTGLLSDWDLSVGEVVLIVIFNLIASILYTYLYFLPYLIANKREHLQTRAIYILNIFAGWTIFAWIIGLIWANTAPKEHAVIHQEIAQSGADELRKYKDLLDQNVITQEEFNEKKKQILGF